MSLRQKPEILDASICPSCEETRRLKPNVAGSRIQWALKQIRFLARKLKQVKIQKFPQQQHICFLLLGTHFSYPFDLWNLSVYKKFPCAWSSTIMPLFTTLNIRVALQAGVWEVEGRFIFWLTEFHIADTPVSSWTHFEFKIIIKWKWLHVKEFYLWIQEFKRLDLHQTVEPYFLFFKKKIFVSCNS